MAAERKASRSFPRSVIARIGRAPNGFDVAEIERGRAAALSLHFMALYRRGLLVARVLRFTRRRCAISMIQPAPYKDYRWIVADPELLGGKLAVRGTRLSVALILECLANGMSLHDIDEAFDHAFPHEKPCPRS